MDIFASGDDGRQFDNFLQWERASRDTIDVKKIYIDMAGDLVAGVLLSQIVFWHLPDKRNQTKLRVTKSGKRWIAKARYEWWDECRITPKQVDRALKLLRDQGLIETKNYRFDGAPTVHIRIVQDAFINTWQTLVKAPEENPFLPDGKKRILPDGEKRFLPMGEIHFNETVKTLTETTAETTTKNTLDATRPNATPPSIEECASAILVTTPVAPAPHPPSSAAPPSPQAGQGEAPTIPAIIKAWLDALPAQPVEEVPPYKNKHYRRIAQGLIDAGYTPANVTAYVKAQLAEDWREVKYVRFAEVGEKLPFWKPKKAAPQFSHPSHKPFDYEAAESSVDGPIHPDVDKALEEHLERLRKSA